MENKIGVTWEAHKELLDKYDQLKNAHEQTKKHNEELKFIIEGCDVYRKSLIEDKNKYYELYFQEKMDHTNTKARIVFAHHILNGDRDDKVNLHFDEQGKLINKYREMFENFKKEINDYK